MDILLAIVLGTLFGFVLQRVGAADPEKIVGMLSLKDLHLMKAILTGVGISSFLLFSGIMTGLVDVSSLSIKSTYWGVIVGGFLLGFGWALAGYCPGTGLVAAGRGRIDALFFILGGLIGAGVYTAIFARLKDTFIMESLFGGKVALVNTGASKAIVAASWSPLIAIAIAVIMILIAVFLPMKLRE